MERSARSAAFRAVITKISIFWDIRLCSPLKIAGVLEEHVFSIFSVEETAKKEIN
jgi:hypothetical protein